MRLPLAVSVLLVSAHMLGDGLERNGQRPDIPGLQPPVPTQEQLPVQIWWEDYDGDGLQDAFVIGTDGKGHLLKNLGDGSFDDVSLLSGVDVATSPHLAVWYDYNGDGFSDLLVAARTGSFHLMRNSGDGTFQDVAKHSGLRPVGLVLAAQWLDYDKDGKADLHLSAESGPFLFRGRADESFEEVRILSTDAKSARAMLRASDLEQTVKNGQKQLDLSGTDSGSSSRSPKGREPVAPRGASSDQWHSFGEGSKEMSASVTSCADALKDQSDLGTCILASSVPTIGMLYPLTSDLFVDANSGNVGIGTASPKARLHLAVTPLSNDGIFMGGTDKGVRLGTWGTNNDQFRIDLDPNNLTSYEEFGVYYDGTKTILKSDRSGNIGIGVTSPQARLHIGVTPNTGDGIFLGGTAKGVRIGTWGTNNDQLRFDLDPNNLSPYEEFGIYYDGTKTMLKMDRAGNVGIGTVAPAAKLHVAVKPNTNDGIFLGGTDKGIRLGTWGTNNDQFRIDLDPNNLSAYEEFGVYYDTSRAVIKSDKDGNVAVGLDSPQAKLDVNGTVRSRTGGIQFPDGSIQTYAYQGPSGGGGAQWTPTGGGGIYFTGGGVGIGTSTPAYKLDVEGKILANRVEVGTEPYSRPG